MTSPLLPGDRPTPGSLLPVPLLTLVLGAAGAVAAVFLGPAEARGAVGITGMVAALLLCAAAAVATHATLSARAARNRLEAVTEDVGRLLQERARLAEESRRQHERLTGELTRERARLSADLDQERARLTQALSAERDRLTEQHTSAMAELTQTHAEEQARLTADADRLRKENDRLTTRLREATAARAAALSATANAAGRMQALATGMLADLRAMEEKHHDEEVLADLLHLDHRTAQAGRLADSVAVLTGARSGRRWARPIGMESILRGAMGRISGYQRVRVHSASDTAVAGHAAEGVMHALAELLDNAAKFSPPTAEVHVYVEEVPAGVIVSVEDSGLVMGEAQLRRAERAVAGESTELGGLTGTRLGLAVVGKLALRYGLKISYRPSARGGTGVLMLIPQDILVPADAPAATPAAPVGSGTATAAALGTSATGSPVSAGDATTTGGSETAESDPGDRTPTATPAADAEPDAEAESSSTTTTPTSPTPGPR
ncbi:ATP-binding protein, partial [Streptomyces sp. 15-116A]|uniref:sensor histidine kinase n=1 Tax=Streptomyces sp. 15-116A TaxID=2259035 RepID=UPI0021B24BF6